MIRILVVALLFFGQHVEQRWSKSMAFRVTTWTNGAGTGVGTTAANWSNGLPYSTTGDEVMAIFDGNVSNASMSSGLTWYTGTELTSWIRVLRSYTVGIGSTGTYWIVGGLSGIGTARVMNKSVIIRGGGDYYINQIAGNFSNIIVDKPLDGTSVYNSGVWVYVMVLRGKLQTVNQTSITTLLGTFGSQAQIVRGLDAGTNPSHIVCNGGTFSFANNFGGVAMLGGGQFTMTGKILTAATIINLGGELIYRPTTDPSAETPTLFYVNGVSDQSQTGFDYDTTSMIVGPNATFFGPAALGSAFYIPLNAAWDLREEWP